VRQADLARVVVALRQPIDEFVRESRVRTALLINTAGQVLAQHGFTRNYEVMNVAALAAAAYASSRLLAQITQARRWTHLHHAGRERHFFLAPVRTPISELILVAIFDGDSSLGIVQLFFDRLGAAVAALPEFQQELHQTTQHAFERDLEAGLRRVLTEQARGEG
jgi:predicted regulator of Ras-like GTPase activity (Roadblock/LC7/MglB family)